MNAKTVFTFAGGVVAGLLLGVMLFSGGSSQSPQVPQQAQQAPQQPQVDRIKIQRDITQLEGVVKSDPGNYQAWKKLGDNYFDIQEAQNSINAYRKALAIDDSDPNVWTDMGVMYREVKDSTQALNAFEEAISRGPTHAISRLNKGVVLVFDLLEYDKGIAAWEDYLKVQPTGPQADQVRQQIQQAKVMKASQEGGGALPPDHPPIEGVMPPDSGGAAPGGEAPSDPATYFPKPEPQQ